MNNVIYLNEQAKVYHKALNNVGKDLILVHSKDFNGQVLTQEAYSLLKANMDWEDYATHIGTPIVAELAAMLYDKVWTLQCVATFLQQRIHHV